MIIMFDTILMYMIKLFGLIAVSSILIYIIAVYLEKTIIKIKIVKDCADYCYKHKEDFTDWRQNKNKKVRK